MMHVTITPSPLSGHIEIVSSKSLSHRYMICAGLAQGKSRITNMLQSKDLEATKAALENLGVVFDREDIISSHLNPKHKHVHCYESGSTLRFMIPIYMLFHKPTVFTGEGMLPQRPLSVYEDLFKQKHLYFNKIEKDELPLEVKGPLRPGYYHMRGDVSSQFISGMLFALPLLKKDSVIELTTPLESKGYLDLTMDVLARFGIHILYTPPFLYIKGKQTYLPLMGSVEGDYSQAAFFMVAGLLHGDITIGGLNPVSKQGDMYIIEAIKKMHGKIEYHEMDRVYHVSKSETLGTTIDLKDIPDLGPILMVLAAYSKGQSIFLNCDRLRIKESDRLDAMYQNLKKAGVPIEITPYQTIIQGVDDIEGGITLDGYHDHRIVMALSILGLKAKHPITITGSEAIQKSFPTFFELLTSLGGVCHES